MRIMNGTYGLFPLTVDEEGGDLIVTLSCGVRKAELIIGETDTVLAVTVEEAIAPGGYPLGEGLVLTYGSQEQADRLAAELNVSKAHQLNATAAALVDVLANPPVVIAA
jgi:hypothetical protein